MLLLVEFLNINITVDSSMFNGSLQFVLLRLKALTGRSLAFNYIYININCLNNLLS